MAICKLCLKEKELCNSHIIPEYYYKPLYEDEPRRLYKLSNSREKKIKFPQKGLREYLFCRSCEDIFMRYEQYAENVVDRIKSTNNVSEGDFFYLEDVSYKEFRLFQLSILFRASICTKDFFNTIDVGFYEDILREWLIDGNPGKYHQFSCGLTLILENVGTSNQIIMYPDFTVDDKGRKRYRFVFGGLVWTYYGSIFPPPADFEPFYFKKKGVLPLFALHRKNIQFIQKHIMEVQEVGKFEELQTIRNND